MRKAPMQLGHECEPIILKSVKDFSASLNGAPVPFKALDNDAALTQAINKVRVDGGIDSAHYAWPTKSYLLEKGLQFLREKGYISHASGGWVLAGNIVDPVETLSAEEFKSLEVFLQDAGRRYSDLGPEAGQLIVKTLKAVRHRSAEMPAAAPEPGPKAKKSKKGPV